MKANLKNSLVPFLLIFIFLSACKVEPEYLPQARPESVGMSTARLARVDGIIREAVECKDFPGAVILVARKGKTVWRKAFGYGQWVPEKKPMSASMMFDLASITKPVATATSVMILVEQGRLRLWDKVTDFVPEFSVCVGEEGEKSEDACIWHLLTHTSGLPPYTEVEEVEEKYGAPVALESMIEHIAQLEKLNPPGEEFHYSCLGFITLSHIVKKVSGKNIAEFAWENVFKPLRMDHTMYTPPPGLLDRCVPTQVYDGAPLVGNPDRRMERYSL